jgi:hypothetical protein
MISEGRIVHWVTEKVEGHFTTRQIVREGPTNFITTTTAPAVHDENETRLWTLTVDDSPETTAKVLALQAERAQGLLPAVDTQPWRDAFEWLVLSGAHEAMVPYADTLAGALPHEPLRIRRDFARLLEAIRVCAIVHQRQRERDAEGRVVASLADFALVRAILADTFRIAVEGLTPKSRELISTVQRLHAAKAAQQLDAEKGAVTVAELMKAFRKPKRTIHNWLKPALELGLLEDLNHGQKGKPLLLQPGTCAVAERSALPDVQVLADACQASVTWVDPSTGQREAILFSPPPSSPDDTMAHPPEPHTAVCESTAPDAAAPSGTVAQAEAAPPDPDESGGPVCQSVPDEAAHLFAHTETGQTGGVPDSAPEEEGAGGKEFSMGCRGCGRPTGGRVWCPDCYEQRSRGEARP